MLTKDTHMLIFLQDYFCFSENVIQKICESEDKQLILDVIIIVI